MTTGPSPVPASGTREPLHYGKSSVTKRNLLLEAKIKNFGRFLAFLSRSRGILTFGNSFHPFIFEKGFWSHQICILERPLENMRVVSAWFPTVHWPAPATKHKTGSRRSRSQGHVTTRIYEKIRVCNNIGKHCNVLRIYSFILCFMKRFYRDSLVWGDRRGLVVCRLSVHLATVCQTFATK